MDNHDRKTRSYNMSKIRSTNTKPEEIVRKYLFSKGFRYRKNVRKLPGSPDIVMPRYKAIIFVNGCFWHKHEGCSNFVWPVSNVEYWKEKISKNVVRDNENYIKLKNIGWNVIIIWECELKKDLRDNTLRNLTEEILLLGGGV